VFLGCCTIVRSLFPLYVHNVDDRPPRPAAACAAIGRTAAPAVAPDRVMVQAGVLGQAASQAGRRMGATAFDDVRPPPGEPVRVLAAQKR